MSATKVQLTGGSFQDSEGNLLVDGYLKMKLNQDEIVTGVGQICSGIEITIQLDASGNVVASPAQSVWGNDQMLPANSFYKVSGYKENGQLAWGPNNQQVTGSGGTFDVGTWAPNSVLSWFPSVQALDLEVNGTPNAVQSLLDFEDTASVTWVDNGDGSVSATATGGHTFGTAGEGWFLGAESYSPVIDDSGFSVTTTANRVYAVQLTLESSWTISKIGAFIVTAGSSGQHFTAGIYTADGNTRLLYAGANAFDLSSNSQKYIQVSVTPVTLSPGTYLFVWGATANAGSVLCHQQGTWMSQLVNGISFSGGQTGTTHFGIAANTLSAGALPATLGALTAIDNTTVCHLPAVIFLP